MDNYLVEIKNRIENEPYARLFNIRVEDIKEGYSRVTMMATHDFNNMFSIIQGGAIFSLADFAFAAAVNSYKGMAVALNININYIKPAVEGDFLVAEASQLSRNSKTSSFFITVKNSREELIATCQALAYIKKTGE